MQGDLSNVLRSDDILSGEHVAFFLYQIVRGLKFLHSAGIIHRVRKQWLFMLLNGHLSFITTAFQDLKPANIAVNEDSMLKVCLFFICSNELHLIYAMLQSNMNDQVDVNCCRKAL